MRSSIQSQAFMLHGSESDEEAHLDSCCLATVVAHACG